MNLIDESFSKVKIVPKDLEGSLCLGLTLAEFKCQCNRASCKNTLINPKLVEAYLKTRELWNNFIIITSGFRCQIHNMEVGGVDGSYHTLGSAIDLKPTDPQDLQNLYVVAKLFFDVVIVYDTFIHCHMED